MILRDAECIYLHSVKTAGTSVEKWMLGLPAKNDIPSGNTYVHGYDAALDTFIQHAPAAMLRDRVGADLFWRCYRFSTVRNPFSRVVSMYYYPFPKTRNEFGSFEGLLGALAGLVRDATPIAYYYLPQTAYTHLDGQPCCDLVARVEDLPASLDPVAARLGITRPLPFLNANTKPQRGSRRVSSFYTPQTARLVINAYAEDFATLGYSTDPRDADASREPD